MQEKDCFLFGTVFKLHGYKGNVNIYNNNDLPFDYSELEYLLIKLNNELVPFFIEKLRPTKPNIFLVKFENVDSEESAKRINKRKVYLPKNWISETNEDEMTKKKLIGYSVIDIKLGDLGKITYINSETPQQLIYVSKGSTEFCFPMHKQFVREIDSKKRIIEIEIPKEFLNLN